MHQQARAAYVTYQMEEMWLRYSERTANQVCELLYFSFFVEKLTFLGLCLLGNDRRFSRSYDERKRNNDLIERDVRLTAENEQCRIDTQLAKTERQNAVDRTPLHLCSVSCSWLIFAHTAEFDDLNKRLAEMYTKVQNANKVADAAVDKMREIQTTLQTVKQHSDELDGQNTNCYLRTAQEEAITALQQPRFATLR